MEKDENDLVKKGVISIGEAFVDLIAIDNTNTSYEQFLGGTTVNVAVGARRLGIPSYYLCKLGTNDSSRFVKGELEKEQVNQDYCIQVPDKEVCKVYVHVNEKGERYFHSYINDTPDEVLTEEELREAPFEQAKIFYFGSGTLFHEKAQKTTVKAIEFAKKHDTLIAFDPNIRLKRWESEQQCRKTICSFLADADILKLTEDELFFLTESTTIDEGIQKLSLYTVPYVWITLGAEGACAIYDGQKTKVSAEKIEAVDTTGAGDAFMAGLLYCFHEKEAPAKLRVLEEYTKFGNVLGAWTATKAGALTAFPSLEDIQNQGMKKEYRENDDPV